MRQLRADELEVRIGQVYENGLTVLLYKNARVDMTVLDEEFGAGNWQRDHKEVKGNMFCGIGVRASVIDEKLSDTDWIWKWDCGTESNTEKEKGEASDSFKRAGFNWGIGRELYTAPFIFLSGMAIEPNGRGGYKLSNPKEMRGMYVKDIECIERDGKRTISKLEIWQKSKGYDGVIYKWEDKDE